MALPVSGDMRAWLAELLLLSLFRPVSDSTKPDEEAAAGPPAHSMSFWDPTQARPANTSDALQPRCSHVKQPQVALVGRCPSAECSRNSFACKCQHCILANLAPAVNVLA